MVAEEAVHPAGEIAGAVGQDRVGRQMLLQQRDDGRHVDVPRQHLRLQIRQVVGMAVAASSPPRARLGGAVSTSSERAAAFIVAS
jgi:hypothetical protein